MRSTQYNTSFVGADIIPVTYILQNKISLWILDPAKQKWQSTCLSPLNVEIASLLHCLLAIKYLYVRRFCRAYTAILLYQTSFHKPMQFECAKWLTLRHIQLPFRPGKPSNRTDSSGVFQISQRAWAAQATTRKWQQPKDTTFWEWSYSSHEHLRQQAGVIDRAWSLSHRGKRAISGKQVVGCWQITEKVGGGESLFNCGFHLYFEKNGL